MKKAAIGVDIGGTNVKLGLVDERGRVLLHDTFRTREADGKKGMIDKLAIHVRLLSAEARRRKLKLIGLGIGAPGPIDVKRGFVYFFPNISGWQNTPLKKILEKKLRMPVVVDNDANAMAFGEFRFGAGRGARTMIALTLGTGIGGGLVIDGKPFYGSHFSAAEMGHMIVDPHGPVCACGNRGCIEAFVGNGHLIRQVQRALKTGKKTVLRKWVQKEGRELTPKLMQEAAHAGDAYARSVWLEAGDRLGTFLAGLANLLDPDCIVIGGGIAQGGELVLAPVRAALKKKAFPIASRFVKVVPAVLGTDAGLVGAAALALSSHK